jgi:8-oxo-dGTP pyrophosphatase MutT (NUDIX family)
MADQAPRAYAQIIDDGRPAKEHSYGIIPFRYITPIAPGATRPIPTSSNTQILLIKQRTPLSELPSFWTFPKGHGEEGDASNIATAIRELYEETGLVITEDNILFEEKEGLLERYTNPVKGWIKEVRYWIGLVSDARVVGEADIALKIQEKEVGDARWVSWEDAENLITFQKMKDILRLAKGLLDER